MPLRPFGRRSQTVLVLSEKDRQLLRELIEATQNNHRPATELALPTKGRWNTLMRIGKVIGGILAVASLVLVAVQTKNAASSASTSAKAAKATAWGAATQALLTYDQTAMQVNPNGKLDRYFYGGARLPKTPNATSSRFLQLATMELDLIDGYRGFTNLLGEFVDKDAIRGWQKITFQHGPAICQALDLYREGYAAQFVSDAMKYCPQKLLPRNPQPAG